MLEAERGGVDLVRQALIGYATAGGEALAQTGAVPRAEAVVVVVGEWTLRISVVPTPRQQRHPGLSPVENQCLDVLEPAQWALSAQTIQQRLERQGHLHGLITVRRALSRLKGLGLVAVTHSRPRGYWWAENLPLLDRPAQGDGT